MSGDQASSTGPEIADGGAGESTSPDTTPASSTERSSLQHAAPGAEDDGGVPPHHESHALGFAIALIVFGFAAIWQDQPSLGHLSVCIGFGLALGVFGNRAALRYRHWAVAGAGAMAIVLYILVRNYPMPGPYPRAVGGEIVDVGGIANITGRPFLLGRDGMDRFKFVVFPDEIDGTTFKLAFHPDAQTIETNSVQIPKEFSISCLDVELLKRAGRSGLSFELRHRDEALEADDRKVRIFELFKTGSSTAVGSSNPNSCAGQTNGQKASLGGFFVTVAYAEEEEEKDIEENSRFLGSEDPWKRTISRETLSKLRKSESFRVMSRDWNIDTSTYEDDLGRLSAWLSAMTSDPGLSISIVNSLDDRQLLYIVQLTGMADYTVRSNATAVLQRMVISTRDVMSTPEETSRLVRAITSAYETPETHITKPGVEFDSPNRAYNTTTALLMAGCDTSPKFRTQISEALGSYKALVATKSYNTQKTQMLVDRVEQEFRSCTN